LSAISKKVSKVKKSAKRSVFSTDFNEVFSATRVSAPVLTVAEQILLVLKITSDFGDVAEKCLNGRDIST